MTLRFSVLASGSTGNSLVVETEGARVLVDAGLSGKQVEGLLNKAGIAPDSLDAILVTHEHSDHVKGLGVLARRYKLPIYANEATWSELDKLIGKVDEDHRRILDTGGSLDLDSLHIESYGISHDAAEPVGYCFYEGDTQLALTTDLGYVSQRIKDKVTGSQAIIMESNHDVEMLRMGPYPWNIKRRILSDVGHLSNEAAGEALCDILTGDTERVYLAHLSRDNNMMELAKLTVRNVLQQQDIVVGRDVQLKETYFDRPTPIDELIGKSSEKKIG